MLERLRVVDSSGVTNIRFRVVKYSAPHPDAGESDRSPLV